MRSETAKRISNKTSRFTKFKVRLYASLTLKRWLDNLKKYEEGR